MCVCASDIFYFVLLFVNFLLFIFISVFNSYNIAGGEYTDTQQVRGISHPLSIK